MTERALEALVLTGADTVPRDTEILDSDLLGHTFLLGSRRAMMFGPRGTAELIAGPLLTAPTQAGGGRLHRIGDGLDQRAIQLPALPEQRHVEMHVGDPHE